MKHLLFTIFLLWMGVLSSAASVSLGSHGIVVTPFASADTTSENLLLFEEDSIYSKLENSAQYPGGKDGLMRYFKENLVYPPEARDSWFVGDEIVSFSVTKEGEVRDVKIIKGFSKSTDDEVVRVIKNMGKWIPGKEEQRFTLQVRFEMTPFDDRGNYIQECSLPLHYSQLTNFVYRKLRYPKKAKKENIEGNSIVDFVLNRDGTIGEARVRKSVSPEIDQEAIRLLRLTTGQWQILEYEGEKVNGYGRIFITFKTHRWYKKPKKRCKNCVGTDISCGIPWTTFLDK